MTPTAVPIDPAHPSEPADSADPTDPVEHRPLRDLVADRLRERIADGTLPPGSRLVERALAKRLGVSRVPVREALRMLANEGFAEERPRRGMTVREPSDAELDELVEVREALETLLCIRLARHQTKLSDQPAGAAAGPESALSGLDPALGLARSALERGDVAAASAANAAFHDALVAADREGLAGRLLGSLAGRMSWLFRQHPDPAAMYEDHRLIRDAIAAGDVERVRTLSAGHLEHSRAALAYMRMGPTP